MRFRHMNILLRKNLCAESGETLVETLVSTLISALALLMLATAITTAVNMIEQSSEHMTEYYQHESTIGTKAEGQTVNLDVAIDPANGLNEEVTIWSDSSTGIAYYERQ